MSNNNPEQIIALLDKAENRIQIAVPWLTDEVLISKLGEAAQKKKVELLSSGTAETSDPSPVLRGKRRVRLTICQWAV